jgi:uncharacterized protein
LEGLIKQEERKMKKLDQVVLFLLIIAGINWGLWGLFEFNLIYYIFGRDWIDRVFYVLLGISGIYLAVAWRGLRARAALKRK